MSIISPIDQATINALRAIRKPRVGEVVAVHWPEPDGKKWYANRKYDELPGFKTIGVGAIDLRLEGRSFMDIPQSSDIADEVISLNFTDKDGEMARLCHVHGEGIKVEFFYWFPQVNALISEWWGHMRLPREASEMEFKAQAASGFRSPLMPLPNRAFYPGNTNDVCGGRLNSPEEISALSACGYNRHVGGDVGNLDEDGQPFIGAKVCPQNRREDCILRVDTDERYLGFEVIIESAPNGQTSGPTLYASSRGNTSNLKRPLRVVYGLRWVRDLDLMAYVRQTNTAHPDQGYVRTLWAVSEGRLETMEQCKVNDQLIGFDQLNTRLGERGQAKTAFSPNVLNYSETALFMGVYGPVDPTQYGPGNLRAECLTRGKADIRVYTADDTYTEQRTTNRSWCLFDVYRHPRYGHKVDVRRFVIQDWIDLAAWCDEEVGYADAAGNHYTGTRSTFNAELIDRTAQQQINDICLFGRFARPFPYNGKRRIRPLKKEDISEAPLFTDFGADRNIYVEDKTKKSSLTWSQISDSEMPNQVIINFEDYEHGNISRPLTFADIEAQLRAGRALGDNTRRVIEKPYSALGINNLGEASRIGNLLLDLGEFDEGGLRNNLRIKFTTWYAWALDLYPTRVIRVKARAPQFALYGFEYFRILNKQRRPDLKVEITAQAYPVDYYERMEDSTQPPIIGGQPGIIPPGSHGGPPCDVPIAALSHTNDSIFISIGTC